MGQWGNDGHDALLQELCEAFTIGTVHIAYPTVVDAVAHRPAVTADDVHVGSRQSQCIHACGLQLCHDILVHQSTIYHCHGTQHLVVRDASSVYHLGFYTQLGGQCRCRASTAMYENLRPFDGSKFFYQLVERLRVFNYCPSNLQNN